MQEVKAPPNVLCIHASVEGPRGLGADIWKYQTDDHVLDHGMSMLLEEEERKQEEEDASKEGRVRKTNVYSFL